MEDIYWVCRRSEGLLHATPYHYYYYYYGYIMNENTLFFTHRSLRIVLPHIGPTYLIHSFLNSWLREPWLQKGVLSQAYRYACLMTSPRLGCLKKHLNSSVY